MNKLLLITLFFVFSNLLGQSSNNELKIKKIQDNFYVYTTYKMFGSKKQSANGMYVLTNEGAIVFDSPWDTSPFQPLLDSIKTRHNKDVIYSIATHSHEDRTSGLDYFKKKGIKTFTSRLTDSISKNNNRPRADFLFGNDTIFKVGQYKFQVYFAGEGHTIDNVVVWFEKEKILYGGCLVKSIDSKDLEYIAEADLNEWPKTIKKIQKKFKNPKYIITGHHQWKSTRSLKHTLKLLRQNQKKQ